MRYDRLLSLVFAGALCQACDPGAPKPVLLPDLTGLEAPVARKLRTLHLVVERAPSVETLGAFARALHAHSMLDEAEHAYLAAADLARGPAAFEVLHLAGLAASKLNPSRALEHLDRALTHRPGSPATLLLRGRLLEGVGRLADAQECFQSVADRHPSSHAFLGLGRVRLAAGDANAALQDLDRARQLEPSHREVHEARARCLAQLGKTQESRDAARQAGDLAQPTHFRDQLWVRVAGENVSSEYRLQRGAALAQGGQTAAAIENLEGVLEVRKDHIEALDTLATLMQVTKQPRRALGYLDRLLKHHPEYVRGLEARARVKLGLRDRYGAERDLEALLRVVPDHQWARKQLRR